MTQGGNDVKKKLIETFVFCCLVILGYGFIVFSGAQYGGAAGLMLRYDMAKENVCYASDDNVVNIDEEHFPDEVFRQYVKENLANGASSIDLDSVKAIYIEDKDVENVVGIELFKNLEQIDIISCDITEIDVSSLSNLIELNVTDNKIENIIFGSNKALKNINCDNNRIANIDVKDLDNLLFLSCSSNQITDIDVSNNTKLKQLILYNNYLTKLNLDNNTALTYVEYADNRIKCFDAKLENAIYEGGTQGLVEKELFETGELNLSQTEGFDVSRVSNVEGAEIKDNVLVLNDEGRSAQKISYVYEQETNSYITVYICNDLEYKINYELNGGINDTDNVSVCKPDETVIFKQPVKKYYNFAGWYFDKNFNEQYRITKIKKGNTKDVTLYAKWERIANVECTIDYRLNQGFNNEDNPYYYTIGDEFDFLEPTREGYQFCGWYTGPFFEPSSRMKGITPETEGDIILYARWEKKRKAVVINSITSQLTGAKIVWTRVGGVSRYRILRYDPDASKWQTIKLIDAASGTTNYFIDRNVTGGTTYKYAIRCVTDDNINISTFSNQESLKYIGTPRLTSGVLSSGRVILKWNVQKGAKKYAIYRRVIGTDVWKLHGYSATTSYMDKTVKKGSAYAYAIQCVDENNKAVSGIDKVNVIKIGIK